MNTITKFLKHLGPCNDFTEWLENQDTKDPQHLWDSCPRADWLIQLLVSTTKSEPYSEDRKPIARCCLEIAKLCPEKRIPYIGWYFQNMVENWIDGKLSNKEFSECTENDFITMDYWIKSSVGYAASSVAAKSSNNKGEEYFAVVGCFSGILKNIAYFIACDKFNTDCFTKFDSLLPNCVMYRDRADIVRKHFPNCPVI